MKKENQDVNIFQHIKLRKSELSNEIEKRVQKFDRIKNIEIVNKKIIEVIIVTLKGIAEEPIGNNSKLLSNTKVVVKRKREIKRFRDARSKMEYTYLQNSKNPPEVEIQSYNTSKVQNL